MKNKIIVVLAVLVLALTLGCSNAFDKNFSQLPQTQTTNFEWPRTLSSPAGVISRTEPAQKILTLSAGHDEILFDLLKDNTHRLVGISSATPFYSNITNRVNDFTPVGKDVEQIVALNPDVVIVDKFTTADFINQLKTVNIPVFQTTHDGEYFSTQTILTLGYLLGLENEAQQLVDIINTRVSNIADNTPATGSPSVILVSKYEQIWASGSGSTGGSILDAIGVTNAAADIPADNGFINIEAIARFNPDVILINGGGEAFRAELLNHNALATVPAIVNQRVEIVNDRYAGLLSHWNVCGAEESAKIIFPNLFANLTVCEPFVQ